MNINVYVSQVKIPLYGCDCYAYGLLSAGHVDLVVETGLKVHCAISNNAHIWN